MTGMGYVSRKTPIVSNRSRARGGDVRWSSPCSPPVSPQRIRPRRSDSRRKGGRRGSLSMDPLAHLVMRTALYTHVPFVDAYTFIDLGLFLPQARKQKRKTLNFVACCDYTRVCTWRRWCNLPFTDKQQGVETRIDVTTHCSVTFNVGNKPTIDPHACCKSKARKSQGRFGSWCTKETVTKWEMGPCIGDLWNDECDLLLADWLKRAGNPADPKGHLGCLEWCSKCIKDLNKKGPTQFICVKHICQNVFS